MLGFKDLFNSISRKHEVNVEVVVEVRRAQLEREGFFTDDWIDWRHYAKVLKAKQELLQLSHEG